MPEAHKRTPRPVPQQRDSRALPLSPTDGYVLSRIDGALTDGELAAAIGLPEEQVLASLKKLEGLGLITFDGGKAPSPTTSGTSPVAPAAAPAQAASAPVSPSPPGVSTPFPSGPPLTRAEEAALAEDVDIEPELRRAVIIKFRKLEGDYYTLLGVPRTADKKTIKRAYFDMAATFHPDRYFRKRLGSFKVWMEAVFSQVTIAHETLGNKEKRADYDAYLEEQRRSRSIEELLEAAVAEAREAEENIEREIRSEERFPSSATQPAARNLTPAPTRAPAAPPTEAEIAARREALARRLMPGRPLRVSTPLPEKAPPAAPAVPTASDAVGALRRRYEERVALGKQTKARTYAEQGKAALAAGDLPAAATAFKIAANLVPGDAELELQAQETRVKADAILSQTYTKQARYEEESGRWADAVRSWGRVCRTGTSDAGAHSGAANALVKSKGDLHEAARLAKRACELAPKDARHRVILGSVYLAAGLERNARREFETAAQLAPHDDTIKAMIRRSVPPS